MHIARASKLDLRALRAVEMIDQNGIPTSAGAARLHMSWALHKIKQSSLDLTNIYHAVAPYKTSKGDWNVYKPVLLRVLDAAEVKKRDEDDSLRYVNDKLTDGEKEWMFKLFQRTQNYDRIEPYPAKTPALQSQSPAVSTSRSTNVMSPILQSMQADLLNAYQSNVAAQERPVSAVSASPPSSSQQGDPSGGTPITGSSGRQPGATSSLSGQSETLQRRSSANSLTSELQPFEQSTELLDGNPRIPIHEEIVVASRFQGARMTHRPPHHPRFWRGTTEAQMHSSWRAPMHRHVRHPGRRMRTGAGMSLECEKDFQNEHDTTVKELASDLKDSLPLGLSLALRAATGNADLVKAADKIKTKHGHVDYAGVLKGVLPESVTHAAAQAKKLQTGDPMPAGDSSMQQDKDLTKSLEALQLRVPVWQRPRLSALREFVSRDLQKVQRREILDVNSEAANLIARLGILKAAQQANLGSRHADAIAVHLK